ncbi:MAG: hypothetical protein HOV80_09455 [Polyangiaceae bacterium]|nr:hypothetical protein [Polyangiaceae bacterium]
MRSIGRAFAILCIYGATCVAWLILGAITMHRSQTQSSSLRSDVHDLWGREHIQEAPKLSFEGAPADKTTTPPPSIQPEATDIKVHLDLDQRLKGLTWYPLYDVSFDATWKYVHEGLNEDLLVTFAFPDPQGVYDNFHFLVDGEPVRAEPSNGGVTARIPVTDGQEVMIAAAYKSRGMSKWEYRPSVGASSLKDFRLEMTTNFDAVDFPESTLSPSSHEDTADGKRLVWDFTQVVSGRGIGMIMPQRIQPGELASSLSFSAPISLLFFFLVVAVLAKLRGLDIHPVNYFFIGAAFFSFHLLFAYTVDHVSVWTAFTLSSLASVAMVTAYLRLVVSSRFAFIESGIAQLLYLVGFSLAHFWQGMTGLTITILSIGTLTLLMLLTGRIRWSEVLEKVSPPRPSPAVPMGVFFPSPPAPPPERAAE